LVLSEELKVVLLMNKSIDYDFFVWCSDFENYRGEGILARLFLEKISFNSNKKFFVKTPGNTYLFYNNNITLIKKRSFNLNFFNKYIILFYGIFLIWINFYKKKNIIYLNYLPLWNFFIFLLLPRKTILGPITGGSFFFNVSIIQKIIRKFVFAFFYYVSLNIIYRKFKYLFFSTDLLRPYIKSSYKNFIFNFSLTNFQFLKKIPKKNIDFLIYYKKHTTKNSKFLKKIIKFLTKLKLKVVVVGDKINNKKVTYFCNLERTKVLDLLKRSKFTIISNENFYSLFCIDSMSCGVKIFFDKRVKPSNFFFDKSFYIPVNFVNSQIACDKIQGHINNYRFHKIKPNNKYFDQMKLINNNIKRITNFA
jgi:hypothetical protein